MAENRNNQRKLVGLLVKLAHKGLDEFAAKYATNLSDGGMFIRTREPRPVGTELAFKVEIASGQRVLQGTAVVRWARGADDPSGPPGMGLQFLTLDPASRALVDRMLGIVDPHDPFAAAGASPVTTARAPAGKPAVALGEPTAPPGVPSVTPATVTVGAPTPPPIPPTTGTLGEPTASPRAVPPVAPGTVTLGETTAPPPISPATGTLGEPTAPPRAVPPVARAAEAVPAWLTEPTPPPVAPATVTIGQSSAPDAVATVAKELGAPSAVAPGTLSLGEPAPSGVPSVAPETITLGETAPPGVPSVAPTTITLGEPARAGVPSVAPTTITLGEPARPGVPSVAPTTITLEEAPAPAAAGTITLGERASPARVAAGTVTLGEPASPPRAAPATITLGESPEAPAVADEQPSISGGLNLDEAPLLPATLGEATSNPARDIEIDVRALVASSPSPVPNSAFASATSGFSIDVDVEPPEPAGPPQLLEGKLPDVAQTTGPVFLKDIKPGDDSGAVIGIDLGTTNSACAVLTKGRPRILSSRDGYNTIPSVVALKQDKLLIGHRARSQMVLNPTQSIVGAKRLVGRDFDSPAVQQVRQHAHYEIVRGADGHTGVKLGPHVVSLDEVQALVLKECRDMAEQALGTSVTRAVVTCPAYYSEPQREAVRRAGAMAGLKIERVLNEPTAAALAFGMNRDLAKTVLVFDLGGGTFDATILRIEQNVFEVRATGGDVFLGGVDFDNKLVELLLERYTKWHKRPFGGDRVALSRIAEAAERAKIALSESTSTEVLLPMLEVDDAGKPRDLRTTLTRAEIDAACEELAERTIMAVQDVLLDAKLKPSQIDEIILVGGQSRMPLVREKLRQLFKKPAHASVNADEAVALGAALYSSTLDKISSLVLIDVVPMTIGVGRPGGGFHRLIERNSALPMTKSFGLSTERDGQTELEVMVFQGEDPNVAANEFLGAITVTGLPKAPAGLVQVAITLSLDAECVLRVEAREFKTRTVVKATMATRYTTKEVAQRLGISLEQAAKANKARDEELSRRAGGFWGTLKSLFKKT